MLFNLPGFLSDPLGYILTILAILLIALPVHECAHGFVAHLLGDDTAKRSGRLTLNPIRHLDPIGALCILFIGFGWAKPVPVNPYNFKHRKGDMAITSLAGPLSNLLMAFLSMVILAVFTFYLSNNSPVYASLSDFLIYFAVINISLCIFNLIPIPPFDGSRVLALFFPENVFASLERFGALPAIAIVFVFLHFFPYALSDATYYILNAFVNFLHF